MKKLICTLALGAGLLLGLSGQDLGDHQKHTLPYAWVASAIMVAVGCVACGLLF